MQNNTPKKSLNSLLAAIGQVAFADNAAKLLLIGLAGILFAGASTEMTWHSNLLAALLILPFILFAPIAGWVSDRYSKRSVLAWTLILQLAAIATITIGLWQESFWTATAGFTLLTVQSAFFSPAKQGILKELVPTEQLGKASGLMEFTTITAILLGSYCGGYLLDASQALSNDLWRGAGFAALLIWGTALIAWILFQRVPHTCEGKADGFKSGLLFSHFGQLKNLFSLPNVRRSAMGMMYFYSLGGIVYLALVQAGRESHPINGAATQTGLWLLLLGAGIAAGSILSSILCRRHLHIGLAPIGALGMLLGLGYLCTAETGSLHYSAALVVVGFAGGIFVAPVQAWLIANAPEKSSASVLAGSNLLINLGGLAGIGLHWTLANGMGMSSQGILAVMLLPALLAAGFAFRWTPRSFLRLIAAAIVKAFYRIRLQGLEKLPEKGGVLLVANHVSYADAVLIALTCPRPVCFLGIATLRKRPWLRPILDLFGVIPVSPTQAKDAIIKASDVLMQGRVVCLFPEGQLTRSGGMNEFKKGFELIARRAKVPVLPIAIDGLWGSVFSFYGDRYFWKLPRALPYPLAIHYGTPVAYSEATAEGIREQISLLLSDAYSARPELERNLGHVGFEKLCRHPNRIAIIDHTTERKELSAGKLAALALELARPLRKMGSGRRIGIVLPPGIAAWAANLAVAWSGNTPVNLNFTLGRAAQEACLKHSDIDCLLTATLLKAKLKDFPWPEHVMLIDRKIGQLSKLRLLLTLLAIRIMPVSWLARWYKIPAQGGHTEATLLFSSGTTGTPKGVVLTHNNLIANITQISECRFFQKDDRILGCLPLFHSFGLNAGFWLPIIQGLTTIACPSALDAKKVAAAIHEDKATVFLSTPTFLRPHLSKTDPAHLASLRFVVAGAEKTPAGFAEAWQTRMGSLYLEGYGLTETAPVAAVNLPHPPLCSTRARPQTGHKQGSVGRLLPGLAARVIDTETGTPVALGETGMLLLKGPNVFTAYLGDPQRTKAAFCDGWYVTGDLASQDADGYLTIEGRLSRFSKIAGEMVPHGALEEMLERALSLTQTDTPALAVTGIPDEQKGEALILFTTVPLTAEQVRQMLSQRGVSNLWIPKRIELIEKLPTLASGKLDLASLRRMALDSQSASLSINTPHE